ncbi:MAG: hypothetical protein KAX38_04475, partial [Candidatus Krumholzibacteria bacterium]|nr:hypothetical protein [Candidatus Krumholzibacteria bacterium]
EGAYPVAFLSAVKELARDGVLDPGNFRIVFAGYIHPDARREIEGSSLGDTLELAGTVSHKDAVRIMLRSDMLLLFDPGPGAECYVHGKLYEYIATGNWILGLMPRGAARRLLESSGHGISVEANDAAGVRRALAAAVERKDRPETAPGFDLSFYERRRLASRLAGCINEVCGGRR